MKAVLTDIEGTTTPISFAHDILFPLSYRRIEEFVRCNTHLLRPEMESVKREIGKPPQEITLSEVIATLKTWIEQDKKETTLKTIQGKIWKENFLSGALKGQIYRDVLGAFEKWQRSGILIAIFSSGSIEAQQLIFRYSELGDLTKYIAAFFDTTTGPKRESQSYAAIAQKLQSQPADVLFLSDVVPELDAARAAGMKTTLLLREGAVAGAENSHPTAKNFTEISIDQK